MLESGNIVRFKFSLLAFFRIDRRSWIDQALFVNPEQHRAVEAVMLAQDLCHHRH